MSTKSTLNKYTNHQQETLMKLVKSTRTTQTLSTTVQIEEFLIIPRYLYKELLRKWIEWIPDINQSTQTMLTPRL